MLLKGIVLELFFFWKVYIIMGEKVLLGGVRLLLWICCDLFYIGRICGLRVEGDEKFIIGFV